jgi:hypothetical protein
MTHTAKRTRLPAWAANLIRRILPLAAQGPGRWVVVLTVDDGGVRWEIGGLGKVEG